MIHALHYEPQGQRQRFEPRGQQEQERHIHLHLHLNLTFRAHRAHASHPNAIHLRRIFAALLAVTVMPLGIFSSHKDCCSSASMSSVSTTYGQGAPISRMRTWWEHAISRCERFLPGRAG